MTAPHFTLTVPGEPRGQARARHGRGFTYKDPAQAAYESVVQTEWIAAGRPTLPPGPYTVEVIAYMARPAGHYRRDGGLSAAGLRAPYPAKKPDADNLLKQVDCLVKVGALPDDAGMIDARVIKRWAYGRHAPGLRILAITLVEQAEAA